MARADHHLGPAQRVSDRHTLRAVLLADLAANWEHRGRTRPPRTWGDLARGCLDPRFVPVVLIRLSVDSSDAAPLVRRVVARVASLVNRFVFGVECAHQTTIGPGLYFPHTGGIVIGAAAIGERCVIYQQVTIGAKTIDMPFTPELRPWVGNAVTIAAGAKVLGGIRLGDGALVAANAVVVDDVAPNTVVGGVPSRVLREPS